MKLNPVLEQFRGKIGDLVFRRYGEEVIVGRKPDTDGKELTPGQATARERFKLAAVYGRTALADPESKTLYESKARKDGHPVFSVTIADFYNAPVISEIDLSDYTGQASEPIRIVATDDFAVASVGVRITDTAGAALEEGTAAATGSNGHQWTYQSKTALPAGQSVLIEVTATDRPGNKSVRTQNRP